MILICIYTLGKYLCTSIALVILICIYALGKHVATVITDVILIQIRTTGKRLTTNITYVILICVHAIRNYLIAKVANVILICIYTVTIYLTTVITKVICVTVKVSTRDIECLHDLIVNVVVTCYTYVSNSVVSKVKEQKLFNRSRSYTCLNICIINSLCAGNISISNIRSYKSVCKRLNRCKLCNIVVCSCKINSISAKIKLYVKRIICTKKNNSCIGIGCNDILNKILIINGEFNEAVEIRFCCKYERIYYRDLNGIELLIAENFLEFILPEHIKKSCELIA